MDPVASAATQSCMLSRWSIGLISPKSPAHPASAMQAQISAADRAAMKATGRPLLARGAAAAAAAVSGLRLDIAGAVGAALDPHHRQDDHCRWLGSGIDIFPASASPGLVRKTDNFAHQNSPSAYELASFG